MKITKHGKKYNGKTETVEKFECKNCNCEFEVKDGEYYVDKEVESFSCASTNVITCSTTVTDRLACSCPECHKIVTKDRKREKSYPSITLNGTSKSVFDGDASCTYADSSPSTPTLDGFIIKEVKHELR